MLDMAKKRKAQKKKFRKQAASVQQPQAAKSEAKVEAATKSAPAKQKNELVTTGFEYVGHEIRHTLIVMGAIMLSYLILWYLFTNTALGPAVYKLIKL